MTHSAPRARVGVWFVGARGSVATTATVGALAVQTGLAGQTGLVAELPEVARAGLPQLSDLLIGGHEVSTEPLSKRAEELAADGVFPPALPRALSADLDEVDRRVRPGVYEGERTQREYARILESDLGEFRRRHGLERVVVVDVSSTEAPVGETAALHSLAELEAALDRGEAPLPSSSLYAYAAYRAGCPVVAFTPSAGPRPPALVELAEQQALPWAGSDGKTGETLLKSVLAPMFATRGLRVRSWASYNLLGGGDGRTLANPDTVTSKTASKGAGLASMLGDDVGGPLHIDYVEDLGEWKTAWDHVHFEGFLGVKMSLQLTWAGCDSALAAPLVLDLARLVARAHEAGESGPLPLGFFFKNPAGSDEHRLAQQWERLTEWCAELEAAG